MLLSRTSPLSCGFCAPLLPALFAVFLCVAPARAQKDLEPGPPKYDSHTEIKTRVIVEEVKLPPKGSEKDVVHVLVKSDTETLDVYLCPKSFLDDMGVSFSKAEEIALTGSK